MFIPIFTHAESDKKLFYKYLFEEEYLQRWGHVKNTIIEIYPELSLLLKDSKTKAESKNVIEKYITNLYHRYQKPLSQLIESLQIKFNNKKQAIEKAFSATMDTDMTNFSLEIILSLFTKSLFGEKNIILSVAPDIIQGKQRPYSSIILHEITHIARNSKLHGSYGNDALPLSSIAKDDLKEIVAPIILRNEHFNDILDSKAFREANQKQKMLTIQVKGFNYAITDYFNKIYQREQTRGKSFLEIMQSFIDIFSTIEPEIIHKHTIYNALALQTKNNNELVEKLKKAGYSNPIVYSGR